MTMKEQIILAIETSCDETAAAVVSFGGEPRLIASEVYSQIAQHMPTNGVVPEIASRSHTEKIDEVVSRVLTVAQIDYGAVDFFAVTSAPGLTGSLLAGVTYAKVLARSLKKPLISVNHLLGHVFSGSLAEDSIQYPAVVLLVSGGHTSLVLARSAHEYETIGSTLDDAAGEAFDKVATILEAGYPGGPAIATLADGWLGGNTDDCHFPRPMVHDNNFDFSFSGLKTAVLYAWRAVEKKDDDVKRQFAYEFQKAVVDTLTQKTLRAVERFEARSILLCGGVAANRYLRERMKEEAEKIGALLIVPPIQYCGDNAAMIGLAAVQMLQYNRDEYIYDYSFPVLSQQSIDSI